MSIRTLRPRALFAAGMAASLALAAAAAPSGAGAQEVREIDGSRVAVYNLAGRAEIVPGTGSSVVVRITRGGSDADRLEVAVDEVRGRPALRIVYPEREVVYPPLGTRSRTTTEVADDGTFGSRGSGGGRRVTVRGDGSGVEAWADLRIEVPAGRAVEAWVVAGEVTARDVEGDVLLDTGSGAVQATGIRGDLLVDTGSGDVTVSDVVGELSVDTGSGDIRIDDVDAPDVLVDTGSGEVRGSGISAATVEVDTGSGEIELTGVDARDVVLDTGSGSVDVELLGDVDRMEVDTGSGSVTVRVPAELGAEVELDTGSGRIEVDLPLEARVMRRDHVEGSVGDGRGTLVVDTGSGGIRIVRR